MGIFPLAGQCVQRPRSRMALAADHKVQSAGLHFSDCCQLMCAAFLPRSLHILQQINGAVFIAADPTTNILPGNAALKIDALLPKHVEMGSTAGKYKTLPCIPLRRLGAGLRWVRVAWPGEPSVAFLLQAPPFLARRGAFQQSRRQESGFAWAWWEKRLSFGQS